MIVLEELSKRRMRGQERVSSRWPISAGPLSRLMRLRVKLKRMMQLALPRALQAKRWRQRMFQDTPSLPGSTQPQQSSIPLIPLIPSQPSSRNVIGNIIISSSYRVCQGPFGGEKSDEDWWPLGL